jgi:hypothetical protein
MFDVNAATRDAFPTRLHFPKGLAGGKQGRAGVKVRTAKKRDSATPPTTAEVLLRERREECENVAALIRRLEKKRLSETERDDILGELSASVLHLHTHTAGLDEFLCEAE